MTAHDIDAAEQAAAAALRAELVQLLQGLPDDDAQPLALSFVQALDGATD